MRTLALLISVAGAYALLRGWQGSPGMLLRSCLAVATLVAGLAFWSMGKKTALPRMFCLRKVTWLDYICLGTAIVFTEAFFVVVTSTMAAPSQEFVDTFHGEIINARSPAEREGETGEPKFDGHSSGNWLFNRALERNLPPNSNHKPSNKPEVFVEVGNRADATKLLNSRVHLHAFSMSQFNGITWSAKRTGKSTLQSPITFPRRDHSLVTTPPIKHRVYHAVNPAGQNLLTAFQGVTSCDVSILTQVSDDIFLLPSLDDPTTGYSYTATSRSVNFTNLIGEKPEIGRADPVYLTIPANLSPRIRETAELFQYQGDLTKKLLALRVYLQDNYEYSLETTNASGKNPLENFLYQEKRGYCEHFATATALICRALGIPSRISYGWSGGRLYPEQNMFVYRAKDAHAWSEIKLKGYGWVVFDTTPPNNNAVPEPHSAPEGEIPPDPEEATASQDNDGSGQNNTPLSALQTDFAPTRLTSALIVLGICCVAFLLTRHCRRKQTDDLGLPIKTPIPSYLICFKQACSSLGNPMPAGRTLRQQIQTLKDSGIPPVFASDLLEYHYGVLYGGLPQSNAREKDFNRSIRNWQQESKEQ
ncbi:MAG: transglutaminase family protein [Akkermansiaceae bacterium]